MWRNPCAAHVLPLFPAALALARALHELHEPARAALRHPAHARALAPPAAERRNLLGIRDCDAPPATRPQVPRRTLAFITIVYGDKRLLTFSKTNGDVGKLYTE